MRKQRVLTVAVLTVLWAWPMLGLAESGPIPYLYSAASGVKSLDLESGEAENTLVLVWSTCAGSRCSHEVFVHWLKPSEDGTPIILATAPVAELNGPGKPLVRRLFYDSTDGCYVLELEEAVSKKPLRIWLRARGVGKYEVLDPGSKVG